MHNKFHSRKVKADCLHEALKASLNEVAYIKVVGEKRRTRLDAAGVRMVELRHRRDEASALTTTCRKRLLHKQNISAAALRKRQSVDGLLEIVSLLCGNVGTSETELG